MAAVTMSRNRLHLVEMSAGSSWVLLTSDAGAAGRVQAHHRFGHQLGLHLATSVNVLIDQCLSAPDRPAVLAQRQISWRTRSISS